MRQPFSIDAQKDYPIRMSTPENPNRLPTTPEAHRTPRPEKTLLHVNDETWNAVHDLMAAPEFAKRLPKLIAKGGENLVFSFEDARHKDIVSKVNFFATMPMLKKYLAAQGHDERKRVMDGEFVRLRQQVKVRAERVRLLRSKMYFGPDAVPVERDLLRVLPISRAVIEALNKAPLDAGTEVPNFFPVWVSVQRKVENLAQGISLSGDLLERSSLLRLKNLRVEGAGPSDQREQTLKETYKGSHHILMGEELGGEGEGARFSEEEWQWCEDLVCSWFVELSYLRDKMKPDPAPLREVLKHIVHTMTRYMQDTGDMLDCGGFRNMVLVPSGPEGAEGWKLKLLDVLYPFGCSLQSAKQATRILEGRAMLGSQSRAHLLDALHAVRMVNALAILARMEERFCVPELLAIDPETLLKELERENDWNL